MARLSTQERQQQTTTRMQSWTDVLHAAGVMPLLVVGVGAEGPHWGQVHVLVANDPRLSKDSLRMLMTRALEDLDGRASRTHEGGVA